jgi:hypothetical protein
MTMRIALGKFACSGIEAHLGEDIPAGVRKALFHYVGKLKGGRRPAAFPPFLTEQAPPGDQLTFELAIDAETEAMLEQEALRQRTTASKLVVHSVMLYLAELDFLSASPAGGQAPKA